jgi:ATP-binding cassette subfamily B protein
MYMVDLPRNFADTVTAAARVFDVLDQTPEVSDCADPVDLEIRGAVRFDHVTFGYKSYEPVAEEIDIDVKPGEMIGLVGHSGSGKTTLTNLIMRFYDVDAGGIYIDGVNLKDISQKKFHSQIGVVLQETYLFAGTIIENIRYAKPEATEEEIIEACKIANAHEFITAFPDGYETRIGEKGQRLSGGEKQRIAIARAIICDPRILILDEATSSLDTENELVIQTALQRLIKGRTTFAIAHRLSTLKNADRLIVLDHGKVAEMGTHNELIDRRGIYYSLVMAQLNMTRMLGDVEITDSQFIDEIKKK